MKILLNLIQNFRKRLSQYRVYKKTIEELSSLSDKELRDLGISRYMIRSIAMEAYLNAR